MATKRKPKYKWQVDIIESERGWGQRVDERKTFKTEQEATKWANAYNKKYNNEPIVPAWYMYASTPYRVED